MAGLKLGSNDLSAALGATGLKSIFKGTDKIWQSLNVPTDIFQAGDVGFWCDPRLGNWRSNNTGTGTVVEGGTMKYMPDESGTSGGAAMTSTNNLWQAFDVATSLPYWKWDSGSSTSNEFRTNAITGFSGTEFSIYFVLQSPGNNVTIGVNGSIDEGDFEIGRNGGNARVNLDNVATGRATGVWLGYCGVLKANGDVDLYENGTLLGTNNILPKSFTNANVGVRGGFSSYFNGPMFFINRQLTQEEREFLDTYWTAYTGA